MSSFDNKPIETIRMEERERRRLIEEYSKNRASKGGKYSGPPRDIRVAYNSPCVTASIVNPGGNSVSYSVIPRNLSRMGIGFLHGRFVYPGSRCSVTLQTLDGESMSIDSVIVRCDHLGGTIHEVGAVFGAPIDLTLFTEMNSEELEKHKAEYERDVLNGSITQVPAERGKVLIVDEYKLDRRLFAGLLERENYSCREANNTTEATRLIEAGKYELVIVDLSPETGSGVEFIDHLNASTYKGTILATSVDKSQSEAAVVAGAEKFLGKPINSESFGKLVNLMLGMDDSDNQNSEPILSTLSHDESIRPLLREFISEIRGMIAELKTVDRASDPVFLRTSCRRLAGAGGGYGYDEVTAAAKGLMGRLDEIADEPAALKSATNNLLNVLTRLRAE